MIRAERERRGSRAAVRVFARPGSAARKRARRPRPSVRGPLLLALGCAFFAHTTLAARAAEGPLVPEAPLARGLSSSQQQALEEIALEFDGLYDTLLRVVERDEVLVQLPAIWSDFDLSVQREVAERSQQEREALRDLLRRPEILDLVLRRESGEPLAGELQGARRLAREDRPLLMRIEKHLRAADEAFEGLLADLSNAQRRAFRELISRPERAALLLENIGVAEHLAGAARVDSGATRSQLRGLARRVREAHEMRAQAERRLHEAQRLAAERDRAKRRRRAERERAARRYDSWDPACWYGHRRYGGDSYRWNDPRRHCWYPWYGPRAYLW